MVCGNGIQLRRASDAIESYLPDSYIMFRYIKEGDRLAYEHNEWRQRPVYDIRQFWHIGHDLSAERLLAMGRIIRCIDASIEPRLNPAIVTIKIPGSPCFEFHGDVLRMHIDAERVVDCPLFGTVIESAAGTYQFVEE